jgi:basic membrane lipoprotein Med (substrate-binding protein (PBP1-ABC) superfamily)
MSVIKCTDFLNENIKGSWEQAIAGYENAIVLYCDHPGATMIKEMKTVLKEYKLEAISKSNKVIIMPVEENDKKSLLKFKKDFLGE